MKNVTTVYTKAMKMSDLIDADYRLLLLLVRLKISMGFGDKSVEAVCNQYNFDADCFVFLANFQSNRATVNIHDEFQKLPIEPFLVYLKNSHYYFLEERLPNIRRKLNHIFEKDEKDFRDIVLSFFDKYMQEVKEHMVYEDEVAFPYIRKLINNKDTSGYKINIFEERHNDIDEKVNDLKRILMKYVSGVKDQRLVASVLMGLYMTQDELEAHTFIEDDLIIPRIKRMEKNRE